MNKSNQTEEEFILMKTEKDAIKLSEFLNKENYSYIKHKNKVRILNKRK